MALELDMLGSSKLQTLMVRVPGPSNNDPAAQANANTTSSRRIGGIDKVCHVSSRHSEPFNEQVAPFQHARWQGLQVSARLPNTNSGTPKGVASSSPDLPRPF